MNARMDTIRRLAESDPYWRAYLDGMVDRHAIRRNEPTDDAWREYARLTQARLDRNADTTDCDNEWMESISAAMLERMEPVRNARATPNAADLGAPRIG